MLPRDEGNLRTRLSPEDARRIYGVADWGNGYFDLGEDGRLLAFPTRDRSKPVDLKKLIDDLQQHHGLHTPVLLRFPQMLQEQLRALHTAMKNAATEFGYKGEHHPVFPMKVNPRREVVEALLSCADAPIGLEAGSKPELYAATALPQTHSKLLICNGFKDRTFLRLAFLAASGGKDVAIVVEKINELRTALAAWDNAPHEAFIGLRAKLYSRGSGKWAASGGEAAKFGLTTSEIVECLRVLKERKQEKILKLLHFHIGSQITNIHRVRDAVREAARVYAKVRKQGFEVRYLDIGGGLGVDYDGSRTDFDSSMNYTMQEFANDVIYTIQSVCKDEGVPEPDIITESGRALTAYHTLLVTSVWDEIETLADPPSGFAPLANDPAPVRELAATLEGMTAKNFTEYWHDALHLKDELQSLFVHGRLDLDERARGDVLFWEVCARALRFASAEKTPPEEFERLPQLLASKYLTNFSVFRSAPDSFAIGQLFPVMPIHRLDEKPNEYATLVDVTCDSDGKLDKFVDRRDVKDTLPLHSLTKEPYYLGFFLLGAYQEVMGNAHNLFGAPSEAHVRVNDDGKVIIDRVLAPSSLQQMLAVAHYNTEILAHSFAERLEKEVVTGRLTKEQADSFRRAYREALAGSSYLEP